MSAGAKAEDVSVNFSQRIFPGSPIIRWETVTPKIQSSGSGEKNTTVYFVTLKGIYPNSSDEMIYDGKKVSRDKGKFSLEIPIQSAKESFSFLTVDLHGIIYKYEGQLLFPNWSQYVQWNKFYASQKKWTFTPSVSGTFLAYRQTGHADFTQMALTAKAALAYTLLPNKWDVGFSTYFTALPLSTTQSDNFRIQFLGVNLRTGFALKSEGSWRARLMVGWYYITTLVTQQSFGFQNVGGPLLFPTIDFSLSPKTTLGFYGKYSPIIGGVSLIQPSNVEVAFGGDVAFKVSDKNSIKISADISSLQLQIQSDQVNVNTYNLGVGYTF